MEFFKSTQMIFVYYNCFEMCINVLPISYYSQYSASYSTLTLLSHSRSYKITRQQNTVDTTSLLVESDIKH